MNLTVNVIIWNALSPTSDLTVDTGGIVIGAFSNGSGAATFVQAVTDGSPVDISVTQTGYVPYSMTIDNVYSIDKTVYIMMVPVITDINDPDYNRPHPYHFYFQDPTSFNVDYYSATSFGGDMSWYLNNYMINSGTKGSFQLCNPGTYQLKMRSVTSDASAVMWDKLWANTDNASYLLPGNALGVGETDVLTEDTEINLTEVEYRPEISVEVVSITTQLDTDCCYTKDEEVTIAPTVVLTGLSDVEANWTISYVVTNPDGTNLVLTTDTFALDDVSISIAFVLAQLGQYTVDITLTDTTYGHVYLKTTTLQTCNFVVFNYLDCNNFSIENRSSDTVITFSAYGLDSNALGDPFVLAAGHTTTIEMTSISLFTVNVTYTKNDVLITEIYILNNYCAIEDCISTYILDVLCHESLPCESSADSVELNQILLLSYTYFMKVNSEYGLNNFYSALTASKLAELTNTQQTMDKLVAFCSRRGCISSSFASATHSTTFIVHDTSCGCGCNGSGWVTPPAHTSGCQTCNGLVQ